MEKLLTEHGLKNIRIDAIDARQKNQMDSICIPNPMMNLPANACTCSHLKALRYFVEKMTDDQIIIFEDDVSFEFLPMIPYCWSDLVKNFPKTYDVIQLSITTDSRTTVKPYIVKTDSAKYHSSVAYLITRQAAQKILKQYWPQEKIDLSIQKYATAASDTMITNSESTYSIPIFTYLADDSNIHPSHLHMHRNSKLIQHAMWKNLDTKNFDLEDYFANFAK